MSVQGAKPLPLAARSEEQTRAARSEEKLRDAALKGATAQFDFFASLAQIGLPGSAKLGEAGTLSGEQVLPFEEELNAVVDELSGTADAERAIAALGEGRFGDALLSGFFAIPFAKPFKAAKWVVKGVGWAGKGLAGVVRRLGPRAKRVWKKLADERGSVGRRGPGDTTGSVGALASELSRTPREIRDAIHKVKEELPRGGPRRNPDVRVDPRTGEVYPELPDGTLGESVGNIFDHL